MKLAIILGVLGVYFVVAVAIARFCAVNAGWEKASDMMPPSDEEDAEPEPEAPGGGSSAGTPEKTELREERGV